MEMSLDYLRKMAIDSIGRYSFLTPKDIQKVFGVAPATLQKDRQAGLITPISEETRIPEYDIAEIEAYLIRKKKIVPLAFRESVRVAKGATPHQYGYDSSMIS